MRKEYPCLAFIHYYYYYYPCLFCVGVLIHNTYVSTLLSAPQKKNRARKDLVVKLN